MLELVCACRLIANNMKFNYRCIKDFVNLRTSEIHLFYNLQLFYWHFLEILWLFIFLVFYKNYQTNKRSVNGFWILLSCPNFNTNNQQSFGKAYEKS